MKDHSSLGQILKLPEFLPALIALAALLCMLCFGYRGLLDAKFHYSLAEAQGLFASLSRADLLRYLRGCCFDLVYLCAYSVFFHRLLVRIWGPGSRLPMIILPVFAFDLIETATEAFLLSPVRAGHPVGTVPVWLPWATTAKWIAFGSTLLVLLAGSIRATRNRRNPLLKSKGP